MKSTIFAVVLLTLGCFSLPVLAQQQDLQDVMNAANALSARESELYAGVTGITLELKNLELRGNDGVWAAGNYPVTVKDKTIQGNWFRILKPENGTWKIAMEAFARAGAIDAPPPPPPARHQHRPPLNRTAVWGV